VTRKIVYFDRRQDEAVLTELKKKSQQYVDAAEKLLKEMQ